MSRIRKIVVAAATFGIALGIGFVMQNGDVLAARFGDVAPGGTAQEPVLANLELTPDTGPVARPEPHTAPGTPFPAANAAANCTVALVAQPLPAGLVNLALDAPCAPLVAVTIHHAGLMFNAMTDAAGQLWVTVPALTASAVFIADIGTTSAVAVAEAAGIDDLDRAVLQWQGENGLALHALEFGAQPGDAGHVWGNAPRDPVAALAGDGGFMLDLGDPAVAGGLMAQVYTLPHGALTEQGDVALSIIASVTDANCGRTISAQTIQIAPGAAPVARDLSLTLPGCDRVGTSVTIDQVLAPVHLTAHAG